MKKTTFLSYGKLGIVLLLLVSMAWLPASKTTDSRPVNAVFAKKKIIFIAGACSHGPGEHEHNAGCRLLAAELNKYVGDQVEATVIQKWPADTTVLDQASSIVLYMDGEGGHLALKHLDHLTKLMKKGIGLTCLHYAVELPTETGGPEFKNWLGGYFETFWSVNPTWDADFKTLPKHPVTNGVKPFKVYDEWYYHMRFQDNMKNVIPLLTAIPPASTLERKDGPHEGNEFVRKELGKPQHVAWLTQRADGGRGFGFTGGHYHKNWGNENFRKIVLNGIIWTAKINVPSAGVPTPALPEAELQANLDKKPCPR
ncbi:MAG: ThuA domain-containing protein [Chitinophagaceae bacterium]